MQLSIADRAYLRRNAEPGQQLISKTRSNIFSRDYNLNTHNGVASSLAHQCRLRDMRSRCRLYLAAPFGIPVALNNLLFSPPPFSCLRCANLSSCVLAEDIDILVPFYSIRRPGDSPDDLFKMVAPGIDETQSTILAMLARPYSCGALYKTPGIVSRLRKSKKKRMCASARL